MILHSVIKRFLSQKYFLRRMFCDHYGFTLIEVLVVVILLGVLAVVILPQLIETGEDAKLNTLKSNLSRLRRAIDLYYHQHNNTYPGANTIDGNSSDSIDGTPMDIAIKSKTAFASQLARYTAIDGTVSDTKDATHRFGPYIKGAVLPKNPYNDRNDVVCDTKEEDITVKVSDGKTGWKFYTKTGVLLANDGDHDDF